MLLAHRIRLAPNNAEATGLARAAGVARFAYNWALAEWQRQYALCKTDPALPRDDRFTISNDQFNVDGKRIRIPKLGWVRMRESLRFAGRIVSATVSRHAGHWYASITVDTPDAYSLPPAENQGVVGVDLGITALATLSTGETFAGPKALRSMLKKLRRLGRSVSRKVKGSCNRAKARLKLAKLHERIADVRRDSLHKLTTSITRRFHTIVIEDLNVKGMLWPGEFALVRTLEEPCACKRKSLRRLAACGSKPLLRSEQQTVLKLRLQARYALSRRQAVDLPGLPHVP